MKTKGMFVQVWSDDDDESYLFKTETEAVENAKEMFRDGLAAFGTTVKIFDLRRMKPVKELKAEITQVR